MGRGISKSHVYISKAFLGVDSDDEEPISFNTFQFSVEGIDEWVGISGIRVDLDSEKRSATIKYSLPEEISLNLNNGMQLLVTFGAILPGFPTITEAKITHKTYFKLKSEQACPIDDFISVARKITTLLCFAIDKIVCIERVIVTSDAILLRDISGELQQDIDGKPLPVPIPLYYKDKIYTKDKAKIERHRMLFTYSHIKENAELVINKWLEIYDKTWGLNAYFLSKAREFEYLEGIFLDLVQGIEVYHRRITDDKAKYESLKDRIISIIENIGMQTSGLPDNLAEKIAHTRHSLIHCIEKEEVAKPEELGQLYHKTEVIFKLYLLHILGFTREQIQSIVDNNDLIKQQLRQNQ